MNQGMYDNVGVWARAPPSCVYVCFGSLFGVSNWFPKWLAVMGSPWAVWGASEGARK